MLHFAANLTMLYTELPFMERFAAARASGFRHVEFLFPYEYDIQTIATALEHNSLQQVLFNISSGDWNNGERGIAANPGRVEEFRKNVETTIRYATAFKTPRVNCLAGYTLPEFSEAEQWKTLVDNLRFAADALAPYQITLVVEFINRHDMPGFFLHRTNQTLKAIHEADRPNIKLQYDVYHAQRSEGELVNTLRAHINSIGHIQIADNPGRNHPGTGEINYPFVFKALEELEYQGHIGLEYVPKPDTHATLGWIRDFGYSL